MQVLHPHVEHDLHLARPHEPATVPMDDDGLNPRMVGSTPQRKGRAQKGYSKFGRPSYVGTLEEAQWKGFPKKKCIMPLTLLLKIKDKAQAGGHAFSQSFELMDHPP